MELLWVVTTVSNEAQADTLAQAAVQAELAACVQVEAVRSTYRWQGRVETESEQRLWFKTTRAHYPALERLLIEQHPYELPALFALPLAEASAAYAGWLQASVAPLPGRGEA
jgi:periplasmic divalent cation tolerance protein